MEACCTRNLRRTSSFGLLLDAKRASFAEHRPRNKLLSLFRDPNLELYISILRFMFIPDAKLSLSTATGFAKCP